MAFSRPARAPLSSDALAQLYEANYDRVVRYVAARVGNRDLAQDLASEVFLRAVESLGIFQAQGIPLEAWLFRVAHNLIIDHYRKSGRQQSVPLDEALLLPARSDTAGEVEREMTLENVYRAMRRLNMAQQQVITLRFVAELSSEEVGVIMGRTNGAVRELQRTALKALRLAMVEQAKGSETGVGRGV